MSDLDFTAPTSTPMTADAIAAAVDTATGGAAGAQQRAPAPAAPASTTTKGKKPSGASRRGKVRPTDWKKSKSELAAELAELRRQQPATTPGASMSAPVQDGPVPAFGVDAEKARRQVGSLVAALLVILFDVLAELRGPHWKIDDARADQLGDLWADAAAPHISIQAANMLPWLAAAGATAAVVGSRLKKDHSPRADPVRVSAPPIEEPAPAPQPREGGAIRRAWGA